MRRPAEKTPPGFFSQRRSVISQVWLWWSTGKDSAWALHQLRRAGEFHVTRLISTVNTEFDRVAMHSTRTEILEAQAAAAQLDLRVLPIPYPCPNETYEAAAADVIREAEAAGIVGMAFGDLFLEDIRAYRERLLEGTSIRPIFPIWGANTGDLAREMISGGLEARITCVDPKILDPAFAGRGFDAQFLDDLPHDVDPCGERGEFHTVVSAGPMFSHGLELRTGRIVAREGFVFADVEMEG